MSLAPHAIATKAQPYRIEEVLLAERLGQEFNSPSLHRLYAHWYVAMSGDEDDRKLDVLSDVASSR